MIDSLRLSSTLHALPTLPRQRLSKLSGSASISGTPSGKKGGGDVHPVAMPLTLVTAEETNLRKA